MQKTSPQKKLTIFIVAGRLGKSLTISKAVPFTTHPAVEQVFIFREEKGFDLEGAVYITLPSFIRKIKPGFLRKIVRFIVEPVQLIRYAIKIKPDLINGVFTLPKGLNAVLAAKISRRKSIVSVIGGTVEITTRFQFQRFWTWFNLRMLKSADAVTTKGSRVTEYLINHGIDSEKIFNLNGSIDIHTFSMYPSVERDIDILFVGNFRKLKGPDRVLRVIKNLRESGLKSKGVFLGTGDLFEEIRAKVIEDSLTEVIKLEGYVDDTASYYQRAKIIVMPSTSEGLPTSMLEAMACGCVPVVSDVGNITDAAKNGENAMVIDHWNDIDGFTEAAKKLLMDDEFRQMLSETGRNTVEEKYTPEKQAEIVDNIFRYLGFIDEG